MRAQLVEESDLAVLGAERDEVLAEQTHRRRRFPRHEVVRQRERDPVVLPHQPTQGRVTLDSGHQLVLGLRHHASRLGIALDHSGPYPVHPPLP